MNSRSRHSVVRAVTTAVVACAFALAGVVAGGVPAWADGGPPVPGDTITMTSPATVTALGGTGGEQLTVTADSTTALVSMTVHLDDATTGTDTLDPAMTPPAGGAQPGTSTWTSGALTAPALPPGSYFITVDATDTGGASVTGVQDGTLPFQVIPRITPATGDTVLSYGNQHPVIAGTVSELAPGATQATPYAGQPLLLHDPVEGDVHLTTSAAGGYSVTLAHPVSGETITAMIVATPSVQGATSAPVTLTAQPSPVKLSAKLSATKVTYGATVTVSGTVGYASGHTVVPLAGQRVRISGSGGKPAITATTDKAGHFTAALPPQAVSMDWTVLAGGSQFLTSAAVALPLTVELPTVITGFQATLNQFWQVSVRGCLGLAPDTPGFVPSLKGLVIQYSPGPHGPWHALGAVPDQKSYLCGNDGRTFTAVLPARRNYAYYRASFGGNAIRPPGGSSHDPATGFLPSLSAAKLAWKYADRFTDFKVTPHTVHKGGKLTITGHLESFFGGKWRNLVHQQVLIILKPQGSSTWFYIVKVSSGGEGLFSATFTDPVTATWSAEYLGDAKHLATVAPMVPVTLTGH
jgi:hypothetical protein